MLNDASACGEHVQVGVTFQFENGAFVDILDRFLNGKERESDLLIELQKLSSKEDDQYVNEIQN